MHTIRAHCSRSRCRALPGPQGQGNGGGPSACGSQQQQQQHPAARHICAACWMLRAALPPRRGRTRESQKQAKCAGTMPSTSTSVSALPAGALDCTMQVSCYPLCHVDKFSFWRLHEDGVPTRRRAAGQIEPGRLTGNIAGSTAALQPKKRHARRCVAAAAFVAALASAACVLFLHRLLVVAQEGGRRLPVALREPGCPNTMRSPNWERRRGPAQGLPAWAARFGRAAFCCRCCCCCVDVGKGGWLAPFATVVVFMFRVLCLAQALALEPMGPIRQARRTSKLLCLPTKHPMHIHKHPHKHPPTHTWASCKKVVPTPRPPWRRFCWVSLCPAWLFASASAFALLCSALLLQVGFSRSSLPCSALNSASIPLFSAHHAPCLQLPQHSVPAAHSKLCLDSALIPHTPLPVRILSLGQPICLGSLGLRLPLLPLPQPGSARTARAHQPLQNQHIAVMSSAAGTISVAGTTSCFDTFRQKLYIRGVLGKKNDRAADGRPYSMRKWTRWYVELRGPVLMFWNLLDSQLSAYLEDITAIVDGRVQPASPEFERTIAHIKNIVTKPNFINITDAACSVVGKLKKRDSVWSLHSSGANQFYIQAVDDRAMNEWVRALRLACFEATKLYEYYTAALINERYPAILTAQRSSDYHAQVRFSGTNDWVPCHMVLTASPAQVTFYAEDSPAQLAVMRAVRSAYSIFPDNIDLVDSAVIAKLEGDCEIDSSLQPRIEDAEGDRASTATSASRAHGSYALIIFQSPSDMASALVEASANAKLYNLPAVFAPDFPPSRSMLYLDVSDIADKSIEIMEPVTARRMLENLASERCAKAVAISDLGSGSAANATTTATAAKEDATQSRMPWDSDESGDDEPATTNGSRAQSFKSQQQQQQQEQPQPQPQQQQPIQAQQSPEQDQDSEQSQKRHFRFLHKGGKNGKSSKSSKEGKSDAAPVSSKDANGGGKYLKRQSKHNSSTAVSSAKDSQRTSATETLSHTSAAPSLPTPLPASDVRTSFVDEAADAIVNLKIVESPPDSRDASRFSSGTNGAAPGSQHSGPDSLPPRQLAESDSESDSDAPLGSRIPQPAHVAGGQANGGVLHQMHRASTAMPALGSSQAGIPQMMPAQGMLAGQQMQTMYGMPPGAAVPQMQQMYAQQQQMYAPDPSQMYPGQMAAGGMPMPFQGRPMTFVDPATGNAWSQQPGLMSMGGGMDGGAGPLLTVEKKVDPIERPTGLVGAIATREQMRSEQKYRDSSSLMKERQMRRNQAMGMNSAAFAHPGSRFGAFPSMYGAPAGWADDSMSMMSGVSGRAPYAQMAPSMSAEQLAGPYMRNTMYGVPQMMPVGGGAVGPMAAANDDDDVALSIYAGGGRMSMAAPDVHPLRAAMQSGMSASSPHLAGAMNPYQQQQLFLQQQQLQQQQQQLQQATMGAPYGQHAAAFVGDQRRLSAAAAPPRIHNAHTVSSGTMPYNTVHSRQSLASSNSGSGASSSGSSPLSIQNRLPANRWVKESSNLRNQSTIQTNGMPRSSTMPRTRAGNSNSNSRTNIASVYELPGRSGNARKSEPMYAKEAPRSNRHSDRYGGSGRYYGDNDGNEDEDEDASDGGSDSASSFSDSSARGKSTSNIPKDMEQFFGIFVDKCLDVKPYAWLEFDAAFHAYKNFCSRNGLRGKAIANTSQFQDLMESSEWQLRTKDSGERAYYNAYLI